MNDNKKEYEVVPTSSNNQPQEVFNTLQNSQNNSFSVLTPRYFDPANLPEIWNNHLIFQNKELIKASINPDTLSILGISRTDEITGFLKSVEHAQAIDNSSKIKAKILITTLSIYQKRQHMICCLFYFPILTNDEYS